MARKPRGKRANGHADFVGADHDKENIERLSAAAAAQNAGAGHNSGEPAPEVIERNFNAIEVALIEIDNAGRIMQKARAELAAAQKTAKTDLGGKAWVESVKAAVKKKRAAEKGGAGEMVTEHRQIGYVLRIMQVPLYTQFGLFNMPDVEEVAADPKKMEAEATLAGEHAGRSGESMDNCPYPAGSAQAFGWRNGFQVGVDAAAASLASGDVATA